MHDVIREFFFSVPFFYHDVENAQDLNRKLVHDILKWKERDEDGIIRSNHMGWHSEDDMQDRHEFQELTKIINDVQNKICEAEEYNSEKKLVIDSMWANVSQKYAYNSYHYHPNSLWSGVYYVQCPPDCGQIIFGSRQVLTYPEPDYKKDMIDRQPHQWTKVEYKPIEGRVIIFPSHVGHEVFQNLTDVEGQEGYRISISFNSLQIKEK